MRKALIILFLFICIKAYSGTVWRIENGTDLYINIICLSGYLDNLNNIKIKKEFMLGPHEQEDHDWGYDWDNDGMGLNPSNWICKAYEDGKLLASTTFDTAWGGWGIALDLIFKLEGNFYALRKSFHSFLKSWI